MKLYIPTVRPPVPIAVVRRARGLGELRKAVIGIMASLARCRADRLVFQDLEARV